MISLSSEDLINLILSGYQSEDAMTPQDAEREVDAFLTGPFARFASERDEIVDEVLRRVSIKIGIATALDSSDDNHVPWLADADRSGWRLWPRLKGHLTNKAQLPPSVMQEIDRSTDQLLERLEAPDRGGKWDRRGLVVGSVQSGKTTHYTSLAAKALDAGYQIVIVLAGVHNSLRSQTHERIDSYLIGKDSAALIEAVRSGEGLSAATGITGVGADDLAYGKGPLPFTILTCTTSDEDGDFRTMIANQIGFQVSQGTRLVMVVKKNASILKNLIKWLRAQNTGPGIQQNMIPASTLVIDDEADHASVNVTRDPESDPTTINRLIRQLLSSFERVGFVGYTATPFANIFIKLDDENSPSRVINGYPIGKDLFPESFILNLKPPSNYIGPSMVFGHPGDEAAGIPEKLPLPMYVPVEDAGAWLRDRHKKEELPGALPDTLQEAMKLFVMVCAVRAFRGDSAKHNSMLIHATRFVNVQDKIAQQVEGELSKLQNLVGYGGPDQLASLEREFRNVFYDRLVEPHEEFRMRAEDVQRLPDWDHVWDAVNAALQKIRVMKIHGKSQDALSYSRQTGGMSAIVIGGDKLSRGLTLEGLSVSYFLRASNMFDTLMQMGRWFGYRPGYVDLCRIYTTPAMHAAFREIALATAELQEELDNMAAAGKEPRDYGLKVRTPSDSLLITAANKIRNGESVAVRFAGEAVQTLELYYTGVKAEANRRAVLSFVESLDLADAASKGASNNYIRDNVPVASILDFLSEYEAISTPSFYKHCDALRRYINEQVNQGELTEWTVALVSKAASTSGSLIRMGAHDVVPVQRTISARPGNNVRFRAVISGADESIGLLNSELASARKLSGLSEDSNKPPRREDTRIARDPDRGLLLIYPIEGIDADGQPVEPGGPFIPAIGISFPTSETAKPLEYTVNEVWRRQVGLFEEVDDEY